jgi:8-oxo-dGTP pyrophosphatase MutT (NUDIX family)
LLRDETRRVTEADLRRLFDLPAFDGRQAQRPMEPVTRGVRPAHADDDGPRDAAALAYVYRDGGRLRLPLTVRREDLREHKGQVSLPGGRPDPGETLWDTARREAREEVGLDVDDMERLGVLSPVYIPVTHTRLHVHLALGPRPSALVPQPEEVERIVVIALDDLVDPRRRRVRRKTIAGRPVPVPFFDVEGLFLWGATAMALSELTERLRALP